MAYVFVTGAVAAPDNIAEADQVLQILRWVGFTGPQATRIATDSIQEYSDLLMASEKDISNIAKDYAGRAGAQKINFGNRRTKKLQAVVHWTQDHRRISQQPTIEGMNQDDFNIQLDIATQRSQIRDQLISDSSTKASEASPGPLQSESKWIDWESKFTNYLSTLMGVDQVPLSYVIRENDNPPAPGTRTYASFVEETVACAPLAGTYYQADKGTVHQAIVSFTAGLPSEDWIKNVARHKDGRRSMKALRDHFSGEGNSTRRIAEAERLRESLHYKSERSLSFEMFLTKCQKMFNIFEQQNEPMEEEAKIRFLFKKIQHAGLQSAIEAMRARITTSNVPISYSTVANHMSTAVSMLPEYVARNRTISAAGKVQEETDSPIHNEDGSIITGYIENWRDLNKQQRETVIKERSRLGIKLDKQKGGKSDVSKKKASKLLKQNKRLRRQVKALKKNSKGEDENDEDDNSTDDDAGDQFGGKQAKKKSKKKGGK